MNFRITLTAVVTLWLTASFAQETFKTCYIQGDSCFTATYTTGTSARDFSGRHILFRAPKNTKPKRLPRLGTSPQFETLRFYTTTQEVFDHLHRIYKENNRGNAGELDKLWRAMGYSGFKDERFTVEDLTPVYYEPGVVGMIGAGGHSYLYAEIYNNGTGKPLKGYKVNAPDGNDITIMEICGNAFLEDVPTSGTQLVSKKGCKLPLEAGETLENTSINAFLVDGKCNLRICKKPTSSNGDAPEVVTNLNHNQQFGPMTELKTAEEVMARLKALHKENKSGNRREIDRLLKTIGYTNGINDDRFTVDQISVVNYEGGVAAVMGGGEHQYMFSEISTANYDNLRGFQIKSLNEECDLTIIDVCGNALYCPQPMNCRTVPCGCE